MVPFGEWLPDLGRLNNPGLTVATNAIPTATGYKSFPGFVSADTATLTGRALASHWTRHNQSLVFAADATRLYRRQTDRTWLDVSKGGIEYSVRARWDMTAFGPLVIATTAFEEPQVFNAAAVDLDAELFADLANAPGWATTVAVVRDYVVMGNLDPTDMEGGALAGGENYVRWSGYRDAESWASSLTTGAGFASLTGDGGVIQKIVGGDSGYIFMQNSIWRMSFIGAPLVWRFDEFALGRGTSSPQSVTRLDNIIYYYDNAGFYSLDVRNQQFMPIGHNKVDDFIGKVPDTCLTTMQATVDPQNKLILWAYCTDASATHFDRILVYQYALKRWALVELAVEHIGILPTTPLSLDDLDAALGADLDAYTASFDSSAYTGGDFTLSAFDATHKLGTLDGPALTAVFATAEVAERNDNRVRTNKQRPLVDAVAGTESAVSIDHRANLGEPPASTGYAAQNSVGTTEANARGRFMRFFTRIAGGFEHVTGLEVFRRVST